MTLLLNIYSQSNCFLPAILLLCIYNKTPECYYSFPLNAPDMLRKKYQKEKTENNSLSCQGAGFQETVMFKVSHSCLLWQGDSEIEG